MGGTKKQTKTFTGFKVKKGDEESTEEYTVRSVQCESEGLVQKLACSVENRENNQPPNLQQH